MNTKTDSQYYTVDDDWLASYCAGGLSAAKRFVLNCQVAINPHLSKRVETLETVGGVLLESAKGEPLSDNFMSRIFTQIDTPNAPLAEATYSNEHSSKSQLDGWVPAPLVDFLKRENTPLKWKNIGFGVARIPLLQEGREKLYLLKSKPGLKMPLHSHYGEEWALILQGGYHVGTEGYTRGDVHREDESCTHRPIIDDHGEPCITLVASEGGVKFSNPTLKLMKPILGI
ncbi:MAG: cupin domain-containing protein [Maricaulaceae bacterium]